MPIFLIHTHTSPFNANTKLIFLKMPSLYLPPTQKLLQNIISHYGETLDSIVWIHRFPTCLPTRFSPAVPSTYPAQWLHPVILLYLFLSLGDSFFSLILQALCEVHLPYRPCLTIQPLIFASTAMSTSLISLLIEYFWELIIYFLCTLSPLTKLREMVKLLFVSIGSF